jgi:hypothetical protein
MNNGFFNKPDRIDREIAEYREGLFKQKTISNKKSHLQQIATSLINIRVGLEEELAENKNTVDNVNKEIEFFQDLENTINSLVAHVIQ